jgi:hypothetical protein
MTMTASAQAEAPDIVAALDMGLKMSGITVLTKNEDGTIARAAIHHRPLGALHKCSGELRRRLDGTGDSSYFHGG